MDAREFSSYTERLGRIILAQFVGQFPELSPSGTQWTVLRVFGVLAPLEFIELERKEEKQPTCPVCWSEGIHEDEDHDYKNKEAMADLLLRLESAIRDGVV